MFYSLILILCVRRWVVLAALMGPVGYAVLLRLLELGSECENACGSGRVVILMCALSASSAFGVYRIV